MELPYTLRGIAKGVPLILSNVVIGLLDLIRGHSHLIELQRQTIELLRITQDRAIPASFHRFENRAYTFLDTCALRTRAGHDFS